MAVAQPPIFAEVYRFLVSGPTPEQIIAFRASDAAQERIRQLLDANKEGRLSPEDEMELDEFENVNHVVSMLKTDARQRLAEGK